MQRSAVSENGGVSFQSHYMPNTPAQRAEMLEALGLDSSTDYSRTYPRSIGALR